jgi:dihydroorotate dehydrogenase electron transfer subunit
MAVETKGTIVSNRNIQADYFRLEIHCPPIAQPVKPGQFVMLRAAPGPSPLLKRPFSVYQRYSPRHPDPGRRGNLVIIYRRVGKGTERMTQLKRGEEVELIGPLGNGFRLPPLPSSKNMILIGGGVGIVSLCSLAGASSPEKLFVFVGGRTKEDVLCLSDFRKVTRHVHVATDDGSLGFKGTIVDLFRSEKKRFDGKDTWYVYSCGPMAMLKGLSEAVSSKPFMCQASLETRMACGFGACYGCVVKTKDPETPYHRVCKEGPVFDLQDILWD